MDKSEMLSILRGKVLYEPPERIQERLNEIADYLETAEPVGHCADCGKWNRETGWCNEHSYFVDCCGDPCDPSESSMWKDFDEGYFCADFERREDQECNTETM